MKIIHTTVFLSFLLLTGLAHAKKQTYGSELCSHSDYFCLTVKQGETWESLFPDMEERDIVRRVNRENTRLKRGMKIAIPKGIDRLTIYDVSPFPRYANTHDEKVIYISQEKLAWAAYNADGELVWWGPASPGTDNCKNGRCKTPEGAFRIIRKQDISCVSTAFPRRSGGQSGGAVMPYCMHFFRGYALHGSYDVPGRAASHGCVRMFIEDARWLNEEFIDLPGRGGKTGTRVIIGSIAEN